MRGDGSIYEENDPRGGKRWVAQLSVPGRRSPVRRRLSEVPDGKGGKRRARRRDAERLLKDLRVAAARGELDAKPEAEADPVVVVPTVAEALREWIAWLPNSGAAPAPRTVACYRSLIVNDLAPSTLGAMPLDQVDDSHVTDLFTELADKGRAGATIAKERSILSRSFRRAKKVKDWKKGLAAWSNPVPGIDPREDMPRTRPAAVRRKLTVDEIRALLAATAEHRIAGAWARLGIDCCARPSELTALRWSDLDLTADRPTVSITRSIAWGPGPGGRRVPVLNGTKTGEAGHRAVTLSPGTVAELRALWKRMEAERRAVPGLWDDEQDGIDLRDLVFHKPDGHLVDVNHVAHLLRVASEAAGIDRVTPYLLRHAGAELIRQHFGVTGPLVADAALGHKPEHVSAALAAYVTFGGVIDSTCLDVVLDPPTEAGGAESVAQ